MEESDYLSLLPHKGVARWSTVNLFPHWCNGNYGEVCTRNCLPSPLDSQDVSYARCGAEYLILRPLMER